MAWEAPWLLGWVTVLEYRLIASLAGAEAEECILRIEAAARIVADIENVMF